MPTSKDATDEGEKANTNPNPVREPLGDESARHAKSNPCHENPRIPSTLRTSPVKRNESKTGSKSSNASSDGSCVQPSIGMPLALRNR
jgi:hypothetical protein